MSENFLFRDLNKNGRLDPYEDSRLPIEERVEDLLSQMSLKEKIGLMFHAMMPVAKNGDLVEGMSELGPVSTKELVVEKCINHFNIFVSLPPRTLAGWYNHIQKLAESTRLGIPVTISTDPRHSFSHNTATNLQAKNFSQWPEPTGLAAIGDENLIEEFANIARQEYLAVGLRVALHPMADLGTEPRWARVNGTFGEEAHKAAKFVAAYIRGFQGEQLNNHSVACMTKHFPGSGPQKNGEDSHFSIGKEVVYPGNNFDHHLIPFQEAFKVGTSQIMPYYGMPVGTNLEAVGAGFHKEIITKLLRGQFGFDGIVCADWGLLNPVMAGDNVLIEAKCWGVENLSVTERAHKAIDAGVDQFGGETCTEVVLELVQSGKLSETRIDESVRRLLREKFKLGLFDNPFVNEDAAEEIVGKKEFVEAGLAAQRQSIVLLKNSTFQDKPVLPLSEKGKPKLYLENVSPEIAAQYGQVVGTPQEADFAIIRLLAPYEPREGFLESMFHSGDLDFKEPEKTRILNVLKTVPSIVDIYLERPAVIPEISEAATALLGNFGASDSALLDVVFGHHNPKATLPFELPSSMQAVRQQKEDVPFDSENPLFSYGFGLSYQNTIEPDGKA